MVYITDKEISNSCEIVHFEFQIADTFNLSTRLKCLINQKETKRDLSETNDRMALQPIISMNYNIEDNDPLKTPVRPTPANTGPMKWSLTVCSKTYTHHHHHHQGPGAPLGLGSWSLVAWQQSPCRCLQGWRLWVLLSWFNKNIWRRSDWTTREKTWTLSVDEIWNTWCLNQFLLIYRTFHIILKKKKTTFFVKTLKIVLKHNFSYRDLFYFLVIYFIMIKPFCPICLWWFWVVTCESKSGMRSNSWT